MYVSVVFVMGCLYSAVSLTLVREKRSIRIIYCYIKADNRDSGAAGALTLKKNTAALLPLYAHRATPHLPTRV